jgi:hypothetical protein
MTDLQFVDEETRRPIVELVVEFSLPYTLEREPGSAAEEAGPVADSYLTRKDGTVASEVETPNSIVAGRFDRRYQAIEIELDGDSQTIEMPRAAHTVTF